MAATTKAQVLTAIDGSRGYVTVIAKRLGLDRAYFYTLAKKWPEVKEALDTEREKRKDWVESKLDQLIDGGNPAATIFYLKCMAKDRGYIERHELEIDGEPITVNWKLPTPKEVEAIKNGLLQNGAGS